MTSCTTTSNPEFDALRAEAHQLLDRLFDLLESDFSESRAPDPDPDPDDSSLLRSQIRAAALASMGRDPWSVGDLASLISPQFPSTPPVRVRCILGSVLYGGSISSAPIFDRLWYNCYTVHRAGGSR